MGESMLVTAQRDLAQLLLNSLDFGLLALDQENRILFVNRKALEILGSRPGRLIGAPAGEVLTSRTPGFSFWSADQVDPEEAGTREVMLEFAGKEYLLEMRWLPVADSRNDARNEARGGGDPRSGDPRSGDTRSGDTRSGDPRSGDPRSGDPKTGDPKNTVTSLIAFDDVTETVGEVEFQRRVDRFASVGDLSAVIAHEIRNPLTGIRTTIQYVGGKLPSDSVLRTDLQDAIQELDRIEQFTTDLLQFARPKSFQMTEQDLNPILETVLDNLELQFAEAGIVVKRDLAPSLPRIRMDRDALQQVVLNVMLNALEAMNGGGQFRVSSSARRYRSRLAVEVAFSDTGCGIPEGAIDKIFDPFFTTKQAGTGLGLSISLQIVREHGGRITVRNRTQGGVIFRLSFPVLPGQERDAEV